MDDADGGERCGGGAVSEAQREAPEASAVLGPGQQFDEGRVATSGQAVWGSGRQEAEGSLESIGETTPLSVADSEANVRGGEQDALASRDRVWGGTVG